MNFQFRMTFKLPVVDDLDEYDERLFASILTQDDFFGITESGILEVEFERHGISAEKTIRKALHDVKTVLPEASFIESFPDIVNLTDLAECLDITRQATRKLWDSNKNSFPSPLHTGKSQTWNLATILDWMVKAGHSKFDRKLFDVALSNMNLNIERQMVDLNSMTTVPERGALKIPSLLISPAQMPAWDFSFSTISSSHRGEESIWLAGGTYGRLNDEERLH